MITENVSVLRYRGVKTAAFLLNEYGTLENIIDNADSINRSSIKESVIRNAERLRTNYRLIKLSNTS